MSDDEDFYDDDDWLYDIGPNDSLAAWADDLVERAMHSPAFVEDPKFWTEEYWSDWEYFSDNYYDDDTTGRESIVENGAVPLRESGGKRKRVSEGNDWKMKRVRKTKDAVDSFTIRAGLDAPVVMWRPPESSEKPPILESQNEKVALLKDWRERLELAGQPDENQVSLRADSALENRKKDAKVTSEIEPAFTGTEVQRSTRSASRLQGEESITAVSKTLNGLNGVRSRQKHAASHSSNVSSKDPLMVVNGKEEFLGNDIKRYLSRHGATGPSRKGLCADAKERSDAQTNKNKASSEKRRLQNSIDEGVTNRIAHNKRKRTW